MGEVHSRWPWFVDNRAFPVDNLFPTVDNDLAGGPGGPITLSPLLTFPNEVIDETIDIQDKAIGEEGQESPLTGA